MQRRPEQPVFARLGRADVVLRLYLLPLHVRLGGTPRFRAVLEQPALPGDPLRRHGRRFFDVLYLSAASLHSRALQLLPHLRRRFRAPSLRGALALPNHPPCAPANRSLQAARLIRRSSVLPALGGAPFVRREVPNSDIVSKVARPILLNVLSFGSTAGPSLASKEDRRWSASSSLAADDRR